MRLFVCLFGCKYCLQSLPWFEAGKDANLSLSHDSHLPAAALKARKAIPVDTNLKRPWHCQDKCWPTYSSKAMRILKVKQNVDYFQPERKSVLSGTRTPAQPWLGPPRDTETKPWARPPSLISTFWRILLIMEGCKYAWIHISLCLGCFLSQMPIQILKIILSWLAGAAAQ